jgi:hypothetical protein
MTNTASYVSLNASIMSNLINVISCDARCDGGRCNIQNFSCQSADLSNGVLAVSVENYNLTATVKSLAFGKPSGRIVRDLNRGCHFSTGTQRVHSSQFSCVYMSRERIVGSCILTSDSFLEQKTQAMFFQVTFFPYVNELMTRLPVVST